MKRFKFSNKRTPVQSHRHHDGFTMVELLMTMLLITIVMLGLAAIQVSTIRQVNASSDAVGATELAEKRLGYWRSVDEATVLAEASNSFNIALDPLTNNQLRNVSSSGAGDGPFTIWEMIETQPRPIGGGNYYIVTVRVTWLAQGMNQNASATNDKYQQESIMLTTQRFF